VGECRETRQNRQARMKEEAAFPEIGVPFFFLARALTSFAEGDFVMLIRPSHFPSVHPGKIKEEEVSRTAGSRVKSSK